jgi:hypothetical protein
VGSLAEQKLARRRQSVARQRSALAQNVRYCDAYATRCWKMERLLHLAVATTSDRWADELQEYGGSQWHPKEGLVGLPASSQS